MTGLDLDAIEARANAASTGPWQTRTRFTSNPFDPYRPDTYTVTQHGIENVARTVCAPDAEFIAAAREDVPALLAEVRRLFAENERLRAPSAMTECAMRLASVSPFGVDDAARVLLDVGGVLDERDALAATVERVEWLCNWVRDHQPVERDTADRVVSFLALVDALHPDGTIPALVEAVTTAGARDRLGEPFAEISRRVTASYPDGTDPELVMRRRVGKVGVEYGELLDAIEGWTGENPRKGVYATREQVIKELIDCASASLCAVEYLTGDAGESLGMLLDQVRGNQERLLAALDTEPEPIRVLADPTIMIHLEGDNRVLARARRIAEEANQRRNNQSAEPKDGQQ